MIKKMRKILGIVLMSIMILIVIGAATMFVLTKVNDAYKGDYQSIVTSSDASAPKALVIYQPSKSKDSDEIAKQLAAGLNSEGYEVTITYSGKHIDDDISEYTVVSFGSPVFFGKPSAAVIDTITRLKGLPEKTIIIYSVGKANEVPELDILAKSLGTKEADYMTKFQISDAEKDKKAYELGATAGRESKKAN